jgi:hypothetical protein
MFLKSYYFLKPLLPRSLQIFIRRRVVQFKYPHIRKSWPVDHRSAKIPPQWSGWPDHKRFALVITHDVETHRGQEKCRELAKLEMGESFRSCYYFVPKKYDDSPSLRRFLVENEFEVGVHGLYHDGKLYNSRKIFTERTVQINEYLKNWQAVGFRSPSMHHNLEWIHLLKIEYDSSTFDTDPFEPQSDGYQTIFPFWVGRTSQSQGYVELPYTLPQDFTLFALLKKKDIEIWKKKLEWIVKQGGMALLNVHPDYMNFGSSKQKVDEYPVHYFLDLLQHIQKTYQGIYWHALPREVSRFWKNWQLNNPINKSIKKS